jgi:hypothetical protein
MRRSLSLLALAGALATVSCSREQPTEATPAPPARPPADAGTDESDAAPTTETALTIYSDGYEQLAEGGTPHPGMPGYALVSRPLHYTLSTGRNTISAITVPPSMDVEAAILRPGVPGVTVESQRYVAPLAGSGDVLARMIGQRVTVEHTAGDAKQTDSGILLAADNGLTLALGDGRIKVISDYDNFSVVDGADLLPQQATLRWTVNARAAGDTAFMLSYPMAGLAWRAEYLATLAPGGDCRLSLRGAALIANRSGVSFDEARLTLVAGEPNRVQPKSGYPPRAYSRAADAIAAPAPPVPEHRRSGEYHAYELPTTTRIVDGATERVPLFVPAETVECERSYVVDVGGGDWQPPRPMISPPPAGEDELPVVAAVSLRNDEASGLGRPLPGGRVRVFDGRDFLGESRLPHTPVGAEIRLEVGTAFDLSAEREVTDFNVDRSGRTMTESVAVTLRNAKPEDAVVRVIEPLPRWSDWEIVDSSVPAQKKDARHVEFDVPVPAGGESRLTYTVRYRWPEGARP